MALRSKGSGEPVPGHLPDCDGRCRLERELVRVERHVYVDRPRPACMVRRPRPGHDRGLWVVVRDGDVPTVEWVEATAGERTPTESSV